MRILELLETLSERERSRDRWISKGGVAIHLFHLPMPRLPADLELGRVETEERHDPVAARKELERGLAAGCARFSGELERAASEPGTRKYRVHFPSYFGGPGRFDAVVDEERGVPLFGRMRARCSTTLFGPSFEVPTLSLAELAAGTFFALTSRSSARDWLDAATLLEHEPGLLERPEFRAAFTCDAASAREDPRRLGVAPAPALPEIAGELLGSLIVRDERRRIDVTDLSHRMLERVHAAAPRLLRWSAAEREFLELVHDRGEIVAELLTDDPGLQDRIRRQPRLQRKAQKVRERRAKGR